MVKPGSPASDASLQTPWGCVDASQTIVTRTFILADTCIYSHAAQANTALQDRGPNLHLGECSHALYPFSRRTTRRLQVNPPESSARIQAAQPSTHRQRCRCLAAPATKRPATL